MKTTRKLLYFACFLGLALTAAAVVDGIGRPSIASLLVASVVVASLAGAPGLVHRRAWPVALVLLPFGVYLLLRAQVPIPSHVHGLGEQVGFLVEQLRLGARAYQGRKFPLDLAIATRVGLLLSLVLYVVIWLAAFLALSLRLAVPGLVIVLAVLGFGFTTDNTARIVWAPLAFLLLGGCLLAFSRSLQRDRWRATDALAGAAAATIAALLALSLLGATSVAAGQPWQDWSTWGVAGPGGTRLSFDWMVNYPRLLDPATDAPVMRVKSPLASYWRANVLSSFSGTTWSSGVPDSDHLMPRLASGSYSYQIPPTDSEPPGRLVTESFHVESMYTDYLFAGGSARSLLIARQVPLKVPAAHVLSVDSPLGPNLDYTISAVIPQLKPADLLARGREYPADVLGLYALLPFPARSDLSGPSPGSAWLLAMSDSPVHREWLGLHQLNEKIVGTTTDPYGITLKIEEYLRSHYMYSLAPPDSGYESPYAAFLFRTKIGYCQHFAGAMAVLLRFNGIPARVAVGFTAGTRAKDGTFIVTRNDAHAWVEVYFPGVGWVPFDPTPGQTIPGRGASSANAGFVDPSRGSGAGGAGDSTASTAAARAIAKNGRVEKGMAGATAPAAHAVADGWLLPGAALGALLVIWPLGRAARRRRGLRRGSWDARLGAALALVYVDLRDHGVDVSRSQTLDETARFLKDYLDLDAGALADRVQAVLFGGRVATEEDLAAVAAFRRELMHRMRARRGRLRTLLALYGLLGTSAARA